MAEEQIDMFGDPTDKKRILELEQEVKNLRQAYDVLAQEYEKLSDQVPQAMKDIRTEPLYTNEVVNPETGQRRRVPTRKLEDWEEAGVPKEVIHGWD